MTENWLRRCVGDEERFLAAYWRRTPAVLRPTDPPVDVLPRTELEQLLDHGLLKVPYIALVRQGGHLPGADFCRPRVVLGEVVQEYADADAVRTLVRDEGATVLLSHVDQWHQGVRALARGLAEQLGRRVEAFHLLTPPGGRGRPVHSDDADVLAVQLGGAARWRVHARPETGDREGAPPDGDPGEVLLEAVLHPGEVLYAPRGFAYSADPVGDEPSAHLSLTVREVATANLYALAQALVTGGPDLPGRPLDDDALHSAATDLLTYARTMAAELTPADLIELARAAMRQTA
ncbi:JmjC domain-containing protein [Kitasatospora sp. NBC_00315]|uniref:JmjC domain-containing protein n=1 Tax=Kitasatospora sp. NBC_00315 TaxID=2975963 RepID=UPI00324F5534